MFMEKWSVFYNENKSGINGAIIGAIISILILVIGLFKVLFIALFSAMGYYIGKKLSGDKDYIKKVLDKVLPPGTYR